ncbi:Small-conductance mechanosensitive channel [Marinitoga hydrogenitolerans DSM 16785]|uniref:Small-conductance mechanosensitive channel n=1 Tax=Marinitoga hydrogenitolerans (strain DSM 16785 / JCM 12826 / AT1271) TaxID=1122195 RepID=A0A1M4Y105_MARH1|nr:mechanosensitive ion channel family protein [Marinitoga hydrogenitolerans]SHE99350.1 Small-conductance mechanosensitive channel [Marinitoga hydrogenitolerans DSM 16785]
MNYINSFLSTYYGKKIIISFTIFFILYLLKKLNNTIVLKKIKETKTKYYWNKTSNYFIILIGALLIGRLWFEGFQSLSTFLGLFSAGLAIALRELITNFAGWIYIITKKPFIIGDRIEISDFAGDVIDISILNFTILEIKNWVNADQSTGRIIHIPNGIIFNQNLANYTKDFKFIWNEIPVLITFDSNWKKAKNILLNIAKKHAEHLSKEAEEKLKQAAAKYMIYYNKLTPIVYTSVKDNGVLLTIRYLIHPRKRRGSSHEIWESILEEFSNNEDINLAYPSQTIYLKK